MKLTGISQKAFLDRYSLKDKKGGPLEKTPNEMWKRLAKAVAVQEKKENQKKWEQEFYKAMEDFKYVPGGRILAGAGTGYKVTFYNCFVIPSPSDSRGGILETLKQMVEIMAHGGGVGINLSSLRPRGSRVKKVNGFSSGPCNWAELFSVATKDIIQQGGCFTGDARIATHLGLVKIEDIVNSKANYYAQTHKGLKKITAKFDNGVKEVFEVETEGGYRVKTTGEHKFLTFDENGTFYLEKLSNFKQGDHMVLLPRELSDDIPEVILRTDIPAPSKFSYGRIKMNFPKTLKRELAFLIGVYLADGSRIKDEYAFAKGIRFAVDAKRQQDLKFLIATLKTLGLKPVVRKGDGAVLDVSVFSRDLVEYLRINNLLKENSNKVFVPEQIFSSPKRVAEAFISGVFFGDGSNRGGKGGFRITSVNKKFLEDIQNLLINLNIASKIKREKRIPPWQDLYTVTVNGHKWMDRFFDLVKDFSEKAYDHEVSVRDGFYNFPINVLKRFAYLSGIQRTIAYTNPTTSYKTFAFIDNSYQKLHEEDIEDAEILTSTITDRIKRITSVGSEQVYDLEVEDVHLLSGNGFYTQNSRRGALMLMLWDWHPDIEEFITVKQDLTRINGANLSVCVSDKFMDAVEKDEDWELVFPDVSDPEYDEKWDGDLEIWKKLGKKVIVHNKIKARKMWDLIADAAWRSAEPGVVFMERYNKYHNNWYWNRINCVNPCVTADTLVSTTKGLKTMGQLHEEGMPFQVVVNGKNYLSTHVKSSGIKEVYRLITREGYELRLTFDHKVVTAHGVKKAGELLNGERILLSVGPAFGRAGTKEEGLVLGWLVGDGSIKKDVATLYFYKNEKRELAPSFATMVSSMVSDEGVVQRVYPVAPQYIESEDKAVVESLRLWRIANRHGLTHGNKYLVPASVLQGSEEMQRGFLQGLFSSDGTVIGNPIKGVSVRLTSVSQPLLKDVQRLLLNFGIYSKIYKNRRIEGMRSLPDGRGGRKDYNCLAYHELVISKSSLIKFAALIGFLQEEKQNKLQSLLALYKTGPYKEEFSARFDSLVKDGEEEVFDITVSDIHRFSANGLLVLNCGEEGLPAWGVCNLGSINLSALVKSKSIEKKGTFDFATLKKIVRVAVRFQDNIVDMDPYVFDGIRKTQLEGERRIGLGTMGLGDALIKLHMRYGSDESLVFIDKVYKLIRDEAYRASVDFALEKGVFPKFDKEKFPQGKFIQELPTEIQDEIKKNGIRNSVLLMQAPTGTTSLMAGTTSGIEPVYEFEFIRRSRLGEDILRHHLYEEWYKKHGEEQKINKVKRPEWFVSANDLTPEDHVKVQAVIQKYVDASISKTVNAPKTHSVEDVKRLYNLAYKLGCKGITYMRDGSRAGVLERKEDKKEEVKVEATRPILRRPVVLHGVTYETNTPLGNAYITINSDKAGNPFELFITVGKPGYDVAAMADALGRITSLVLRLQSDVPSRERIRRIITQLTGIGGRRTVGFGENRVASVPDAVAKVLAEQFGFKINGGVKDMTKNNDLSQGNITSVVTGNGVSVTGNGQAMIGNGVNDEKSQKMIFEQLPAETHEASSLFDLCPSCGSASLAHEEGCKKCYSCGYSEC